MTTDDILGGRVIAGWWEFIAGRPFDHFLGSIPRHVDLLLDQTAVITVAEGSAQVHIRGEFLQRLGQLNGALCAHDINLYG